MTRIKLEAEDMTPFAGVDEDALRALIQKTLANMQEIRFLPVVKVAKKYLNNVSLILAKHISPEDFGEIQIKENKQDDFAWVLVREDEDNAFCLVPQIRKVLKDFAK